MNISLTEISNYARGQINSKFQIPNRNSNYICTYIHRILSAGGAFPLCGFRRFCEGAKVQDHWVEVSTGTTYHPYCRPLSQTPPPKSQEPRSHLPLVMSPMSPFCLAVREVTFQTCVNHYKIAPPNATAPKYRWINENELSKPAPNAACASVDAYWSLPIDARIAGKAA